MKLFHLYLLLVSLLFLSACGSRSTENAWLVYHAASNTKVNPNFPAYSFEYPSGWAKEEDVNQTNFASDAKLLKDVPEKLEPGQIITVLSLNSNMTPEEMLDTYASKLSNTIQFNDPVSIIVNGYPAAYQKGHNSETGDETFLLAADIEQNMGGLLSARIAEGELDGWKETLFRIAQSLQIER